MASAAPIRINDINVGNGRAVLFDGLFDTESLEPDQGDDLPQGNAEGDVSVTLPGVVVEVLQYQDSLDWDFDNSTSKSIGRGASLSQG